MPPLLFVQLWILISALASVAGWTLSAAGQLNRAGYTIFFLATILLVSLHRRARSWFSQFGKVNWQKLSHRFRRPLSAGFLILASLVFLSGILYPPTNHTALTYRIPRVLQWLAHEHWFWIHTENYRMNNRACGIEWLSAPLLLFTKSDRGLFLLNFIPFLLLPGLVFSVCKQLGVRARAAWQWMWILPTGYNFLLQAGGAANDTFPTVYALAMIDFGLRAWVPDPQLSTLNSRFKNLAFSLLAAALLVGAKASNLPLLLPWAILIFPLLKLLRQRPIVSVGLILVAATVSFLPTAILNIIYCGDWSGLNLERTGMDMKNPFIGIWGNALLLLLNNFVPPFFPIAGWWNQNILTHLPGFIVVPMTANFEQGFHWLGELPTEDWAGLGFGVGALLAISFLAALRCPRQRFTINDSRFTIPPLIRRAVLITPWLALLAYCAKSGMVTAARLISPYYPLLLPVLLLPLGHSRIIRQRWWRVLVVGNFILALSVLILLPARPLWPAQTILTQTLKANPEHPLLKRAQKVYSVYAGRSDSLAGVRELLPHDLRVIGFAGGADDMDLSLWRPYGTKRVEHILTSDSPEQIRARGIGCAVVEGNVLRDHNVTLENWLQQTRAELIATTNITVKISTGSQTWHVVRFKN